MIYEYFCAQCGREYEIIQKIGDEPLTECPKCREDGKDSPAPKRLISLSSFALKGGGWADNGYGNK